MAATVAAVALLLGACGSSADDGDGVASLDQDSTGTEASAGATPSASSEPDHEGAMLAFAQCMRDNGVEDFPDPETDGEGGAFRMEIAEDGESSVHEEAMKACEDLLPQGGAATGGEDGRPVLDSEAALAFSECMRDNGVEDFPDPDSEGMPDPDKIMELDVESQEFQDAITACGDETGFGFAFNAEGSASDSSSTRGDS